MTKEINPMAQQPTPIGRSPVKHTQGSPTGKMAYHPNKSPGAPQLAPMDFTIPGGYTNGY